MGGVNVQPIQPQSHLPDGNIILLTAISPLND